MVIASEEWGDQPVGIVLGSQGRCARRFRRRRTGADVTRRPSHHDDDAEPDSKVRNTFSAPTGSGVVQARDIGGGVHFHTPAPAPLRRPAQLPGEPRGFVNRTDEVRLLDSLLGNASTGAPDHGVLRIALVVGTPGAGKSSLAVHWAHRVRNHFPDGQLYVNLHGYDPGPRVATSDVLGRFLRALDVPLDRIPAGEEPRAELFRSVTAEQRVLIVLDNAAGVGDVRPLLPGSPNCLVTITSRTRMSGLVIREGAHRVSVETLSPAESVRLLRTVIAGHRTGDDESDLVELARLCAGLPLALRIVAERAAARPHMPLRDLITELRDESGLWDALSVPGEGAADEADAVRTVFAWSYRALSPPVARVFRLLGLHPGPEFSVEAAAALTATTPVRARRYLDVLTGAHLLEECGHDRYQFHDLLRAFATDQARHWEPEDGRREALRRVLVWYLHSAAAAARTGSAAYGMALDLEPLSGPRDEPVEAVEFHEAKAAIAWYEAERDNLISSVRVADSHGMHGIAWQIPATVTMLIADREPADTWLPAQRQALSSAHSVGDRYGEAITLDNLGIAFRHLYRLDEADACFSAALAAFRELGDTFGQAKAANGLGVVRLFAHRFEEAASCFEQALEQAVQLDDPVYVGAFTRNLGWVLLEHGAPEGLGRAEELLNRSATVLAATNEPLEQAEALTLLAAVHRRAGRHTSAQETAERALAIAGTADGKLFEGLALLELGRILLARGKGTEALGCLQQAAVLFPRVGRLDLQAAAWGVTGEAYLSLGRAEDAVAFHRQAIAVFHAKGDQWSQALSLAHLATALTRQGSSDEAGERRREALGLLRSFPGPAARARRSDIEAQAQAPRRPLT
ncbi:ATP-binding protein [Nocardiopsis sp. NPDC006938]|uniref:ATP-binding protein n=1 Tax=Nocardiopsis sp. NPDC006938 TaxID=3364337 RepID=UPI00368A4187